MNHAFIIWLGQAIGAAALSVLTAATTGTMALVNLVFDSSQGTPTIYVGAQQALNPGANGLTFPTNGSQSGVILKDATQTIMYDFTIPCTNTGGLSKYDTCIAANPLGQSGALTRLVFGCSAPLKTFVMSGSFVKSRGISATATSIVGYGNHTYGTGSWNNLALTSVNSGSVIWNRDDFFKAQVASTTVSTATSALNTCRFRASMLNPNIR